MNVYSRRFQQIMVSGIGAALLVIGASAMAQNAVDAPSIARPTEFQNKGIANSITLRGENHSITMQKLKVLRQYDFVNLRTNPIVVLNGTKLNFEPMLANPTALSNIARKLRTLPKQVDVSKDMTTVSEVDQGLVIRSTIRYRVRSGQCENIEIRANFLRLECLARRKNQSPLGFLQFPTQTIIDLSPMPRNVNGRLMP